MVWEELKLWADDEEKRIHQCILHALKRLIESRQVDPEDGELKISGKLRPFLIKAKKELRLIGTLHSEGSRFATEDAEKPFGHPDFYFSQNTPDNDQFDYDIECKLVRVKRIGKEWDYCEKYVIQGIQRFQSRKYAQSFPPMGTMIGYIQEGETVQLLALVNKVVIDQGWDELKLIGTVNDQDITHFNHPIRRKDDELILFHLWADVRPI